MPEQPANKPAVVPVQDQNIPAVLKEASRWVCWRWTWRPDKGPSGGWDKPPLQAANARAASSTDPATWTTFDVALAAQRCGKMDGVGLVLGEDRRLGVTFAGFDSDGSIGDDGVIDAGSVFLASLLDSYAEKSPSWRGFKVFTLGKWPAGHRCSDRGGRFELYDSGRYFTVTGCKLDFAPPDVAQRTQEMAKLYDHLFPARAPLYKTGVRRTDRQRAVAALAGLDKSRAEHYQSWLLVGMALKAVGEDLLEEWDAWSAQYVDEAHGYAPGVCARKWESFRKSGVGLGSLLYWAAEDGWKEEAPGEPPAVVLDDGGDDDPHMGDGLTEEAKAGPWKLVIVHGEPTSFLLRSPIWAACERLGGGFLPLSEKQLISWPRVRLAALAHGIYCLPDHPKEPVWDGRGGRHLLRRLLRNARQAESRPEYDRVLAAMEYLLDVGRRARTADDDAAAQGHNALFRLEDGSIVFRLMKLSGRLAREAPCVRYEDLRDGAQKYAKEWRPPGTGVRPRYLRLGTDVIRQLTEEIDRRAAVGWVLSHPSIPNGNHAISNGAVNQNSFEDTS